MTALSMRRDMESTGSSPCIFPDYLERLETMAFGVVKKLPKISFKILMMVERGVADPFGL